MDKKRRMSDVDLPLVAARAVASCGASPCGDTAGTARDPREIRERSIARELNIPAGNVAAEEYQGSNLVQLGGEVYEIRPVEETAAPAVPAEAGSVVRRNRPRRSDPNRTRRSVPPGRNRNGLRRNPRRVHRPDRDPGHLYWSRENIQPRGGSSGRSSATTREPPGPGVVAARTGGDLVEADLLGSWRPWRRSTGMTFREIFEGMHRKDPGVTSCALAGVDGLTVESGGRRGTTGTSPPFAPSPSSFSGSPTASRRKRARGGGRVPPRRGPRAGLPPQGGPGYFLVIVAAPGPSREVRFLLRQAARRTREIL